MPTYSSLNKVDLVTPQEIERIKAWLDDRFHRYRLVEASGGNVPWKSCCRSAGSIPRNSMDRLRLTGLIILPTVIIPIVGIHVHGHRRDHSQVFTTWSYETEEPMSLEALRDTARRLPAGVYRCKGVVHTAEEPGRRVILQVVGKRVDIAVGDEWAGREPRTRLVAIGSHDGVDEASLRQAFEKCHGAAAH